MINVTSGAVSTAVAIFILGIVTAATAATSNTRNTKDSSTDFRDAAIQVSQAAIGNKVGDYEFRNRWGKSVKLSDFHGKPLVISLIYTSCYHTCPMITKQLTRVVEIAYEALGEESFAVATIGFDTPMDTPERMRMYAKARGIDDPGWSFLSADAETIDDLVRDLGFTYFRSPKGFDHLAQTSVLDAEGRVYRQVYGEILNSPNFVEPLKELVFGLAADPSTVSGWLNGIRLFCTIYDPSSDRYRFDYSIFVALIVGTLSLGSVGVFIARAWRQSKPPNSAT